MINKIWKFFKEKYISISLIYTFVVFPVFVLLNKILKNITQYIIRESIANWTLYLVYLSSIFIFVFIIKNIIDFFKEYRGWMKHVTIFIITIVMIFVFVLGSVIFLLSISFKNHEYGIETVENNKYILVYSPPFMDAEYTDYIYYEYANPIFRKKVPVYRGQMEDGKVQIVEKYIDGKEAN